MWSVSSHQVMGIPKGKPLRFPFAPSRSSYDTQYASQTKLYYAFDE